MRMEREGKGRSWERRGREGKVRKERVRSKGKTGELGVHFVLNYLPRSVEYLIRYSTLHRVFVK